VLLGKALAWFAHNGVGDTSMRTLAAQLGTSHRMLHYHFGSREGLLSAVVDAVERQERDQLAALLASYDDPFEAGLAFWSDVANAAQTFAPLYFELAGQAMQGRPHASALREWLLLGWVEALTSLYAAAGHPPARATELARLSLAMARGLLFDLALTADREAVDASMSSFVEMARNWSA
jgi:AcrR family transcriptional regulator